MPTSAPEIQAGLTQVTAEAQAEVLALLATQQSIAQLRAALYEAVPLIVGEYSLAAASLAADWYEELRDAVKGLQAFTPTVIAPVREDYLANVVAWSTRELYDLEQDRSRLERELSEEVARKQAMLRIQAEVQKETATGFRDTITENVVRDPNTAGWRRHARPGACAFCLMLASRGAVFKRTTANFAAHTNCHCVAVPVFDDGSVGAEASAIQYVASKRTRTAKERADLRAYLKQRYGTADTPAT